MIPDGGDVYIAETDFDAIMEAAPTRVVPIQPGKVYVNDVLVTWNCVGRELYDEAWRAAIKSCRRRQPSPVIERSVSN